MPDGRSAAWTQRTLPIEQVEQSDEAYLAAIADCRLPPATERVLEWIVRNGRRDRGCKVVRRSTQRKWARAIGLSPSTISTTLRRLGDSRLVLKSPADGALRLDLSHLVAVAEEARARDGPGDEPFDAAAALRRLGSRSAALGSARPRSAVIGSGARSVNKKRKPPVPLTEAQESADPTETVGTGAAEHADRSRTRRAEASTPDCLKNHAAWRSLQRHHFRPELDRQALRAAFYAAVEAGLLADDYESRLRFLATAFDLAWDDKIRSPVAVLRSRIERGSCYRQSDRALATAKEFLRDPSLACERNA